MRKKVVRGGLRTQLLLAAIVFLASVLPFVDHDNPAISRARGYNPNPGDPFNRGCKARCGAKNDAIASCRGRVRKTMIKRCSAVAKAAKGQCIGDASCKQQVVQNFQTCRREATKLIRDDVKRTRAPRYGIVRCNGCCIKRRLGSGCISYFSGSRFYGASRYKGRLRDCEAPSDDGGGGGEPGGGKPCEVSCQREAQGGEDACGKGKRGGDPLCLAGVRARLGACLAACSSVGGARVLGPRDVSERVRAGVGSLIPSLVQGW